MGVFTFRPTKVEEKSRVKHLADLARFERVGIFLTPYLTIILLLWDGSNGEANNLADGRTDGEAS